MDSALKSDYSSPNPRKKKHKTKSVAVSEEVQNEQEIKCLSSDKKKHKKKSALPSEREQYENEKEHPSPKKRHKSTAVPEEEHHEVETEDTVSKKKKHKRKSAEVFKGEQHVQKTEHAISKKMHKSTVVPEEKQHEVETEKAVSKKKKHKKKSAESFEGKWHGQETEQDEHMADGDHGFKNKKHKKKKHKSKSDYGKHLDYESSGSQRTDNLEVSPPSMIRLSIEKRIPKTQKNENLEKGSHTDAISGRFENSFSDQIRAHKKKKKKKDKKEHLSDSCDSAILESILLPNYSSGKKQNVESYDNSRQSYNLSLTAGPIDISQNNFEIGQSVDTNTLTTTKSSRKKKKEKTYKEEETLEHDFYCKGSSKTLSNVVSQTGTYSKKKYSDEGNSRLLDTSSRKRTQTSQKMGLDSDWESDLNLDFLSEVLEPPPPLFTLNDETGLNISKTESISSRRSTRSATPSRSYKEDSEFESFDDDDLDPNFKPAEAEDTYSGSKQEEDILVMHDLGDEWQQSSVLDFPVPRLHDFNKLRLSTSEREALTAEGVQIKKGKFTLQEDEILRRNWENIIETFKLSNPSEILGIQSSEVKSHGKLIQRFIYENRIYQRLGKDLNDRLLEGIYKRARLLFHPQKEVIKKFSDDQLNELFKLHQRYGGKWEKIASLLNTDSASIRLAFRYHSLSNKKGPWTEEEDNKLLDIMIKLLEDGYRETEIPWKKVSLALGGRSESQCRHHWLGKMTWSIQQNQPRKSWTYCDTINLLRLLCEFVTEIGAEREDEVDWITLKKEFYGSVSYAVLERKWYEIKIKLPDHKRQSLYANVILAHNTVIPELLSKHQISFQDAIKKSKEPP